MFKILKDISAIKTGKSLKRNDFDDVYNSFMIQRWLSMYSDLNVDILNASVNSLDNTLTNEQKFMLLINILPSTTMSNKYIKGKKTKKVKSKAKDTVIDVSAYFEESSSKIEDSLKLVLGEKYNGK